MPTAATGANTISTLAAPAGAGETMLLLHGTSSRAVERAQQQGSFQPGDPRRTAREVAEHFELEAQELYQHPWFQFSRDRAGDPCVYLTETRRVAASHAAERSESRYDALRTAFRMLGGDPYNDHDRFDEFTGRYYTDQDLRPAIVTFSVPAALIGRSRDYQSYVHAFRAQAELGRRKGASPMTLAEWLSVCRPLGALAIPEPLPFGLVAAVETLP